MKIIVDSGKYLSDYLHYPERGGVWLLSADTGIGKTYWALGLYERHKQKTLVVTSLTGIVKQGGKLEHVDYYYGERKTFCRKDNAWLRGGNTIICTYDSAERVAELINIENYIVIFDESHNIAFSGYRSNAINVALNVAESAKAIVAMSGTIRPIAHPALSGAYTIHATRKRKPINATFVKAKGQNAFIRRALASIDLNGRNVLFFNKKGGALDTLVESIKHEQPLLNIIKYNADTKEEQAIQDLLAIESIPNGTLVIATAVMVEGINIESIDNLLIATPLHVELCHQLASRARLNLGKVFYLMPESWAENEGIEEDIESIYFDTVKAMASRANGIIGYRAFLASVDTRDLFEFNAIAPKITREEADNEVIDYVIVDCIAHAKRAKAMNQQTAERLLSGYGWVIQSADWQDRRIDRMNETDTKNAETWQRIQDLDYSELVELSQKWWVADSKLTKMYVNFLEGLADNEADLYESWLLDTARALFDPEKPTKAKRVLGIIEHARNEHTVYKTIRERITFGEWDKKPLAEFIADCASDSLLYSEVDKLRWFNPSEESDCMRVLKIIKRYLDVRGITKRVGDTVSRKWVVKGLAIDTLDIAPDTLARLITERNDLIERRNKKLVANNHIDYEPLKTFIDIQHGGVIQSAELITNKNGLALVTLRTGENVFVIQDTSGVWCEYGTVHSPIESIPTPAFENACTMVESIPTINTAERLPTQSAFADSWAIDLARRYGDYAYD